jgi:hypothetical protein
MAMNSPEKVLVGAEEAIKALKKFTPGWKNEEALSQFARLTEELRFHAGPDAYAREKITGLQSFAEILYSPRKHLKYDSPRETGIDRVKSICYSYASNLESWAKRQISGRASPEESAR